jgi:hypothetical protein
MMVAWEMKSLKRTGWILFIFFILSACQNADQEGPGAGKGDQPFLPPTPAASASLLDAQAPTPSSAPEEVATLSSPSCSNVLTFLEDVTIPDGTFVRPGELLDKRWLVKNDGTCNWNERYRLKLASGSSLGTPEEQALYPARSGSQVEIRILFTAPQEAGIQRSSWQAFSPAGEAFGEPFFIEIQVESPPP